MSDQTFKAIEDAITEHLADELPERVGTAWAVVIGYINPEETYSDEYAVVHPEHQSDAHTHGLFKYGSSAVEDRRNGIGPR